MADYAPPSGPPPPKAPDVPPGWAVRWNDQYKEWFYVNIYTKQSQWNKPTAPVYPDEPDAPAGPPPGYTPGNNAYASDSKSRQQEDEDARLAAKLQAEEDSKRAAYAGEASSYQQQQQQSFPQNLPPRDARGKQGGGFLGKLLGKASGSRPPQQEYYGGGYAAPPPPQQPGYGYAPPAGYAQPGYGQPAPYGYAQPPPQGYGYAQQQAPQKSGMGKGGMAIGLAGGAAAGLVGGMLLNEAIEDHDERIYDEGYMDGQDGDFDGGW